ncbi:carbon-monoxide dehydrogenase catalytic subunit [Methanofollis sp. W23]|nr:carbon-monoxide dehydrogenase catalytic subunit [Methanofollis sp. W23]
MGPCRIIPATGRVHGVCGADADLIVARNLLDTIVTGAAAHADHGLDLVEALHRMAEAGGVGADPGELRESARRHGVQTDPQDDTHVAHDLAHALYEECWSARSETSGVRSAPAQTRAIWAEAGISPRGVGREIVEAMHRVHMGVGADYRSLLLHGLRTALSDGWGGSMVATECSDFLFGTPTVRTAEVNLGVLRDDQVNIALHGHNPLLCAEMVRGAADPDLLARARALGATGINLVGLCCTGSELLMRGGIPLAGNHLDQELVIATGALEAAVVDYQCIFPSLPQTAACFHTHIISTSQKARLPGALYIPFNQESAHKTAHEIIRLAVENFQHRDHERAYIPGGPVRAMTGYSVEALTHALGGGLDPLARALTDGQVQGIAAVVGCNNPKVSHDAGHVTLVRELLSRDILVVGTGCAAIAAGKAGLMRREAADAAGPGLASFCKTYGIPPVLHMGSCVDNSRVLTLAAALAEAFNVGIDRLPLAGAAPEWYSQKAVSIALYFVASGITTVLGVMPMIAGSQKVVDLLTTDLAGVVGATLLVEPSPLGAADLIEAHIMQKREELRI